MPIIAPADLPASGTLLAVDPGKRHFGIAASDARQRIAMPISTLVRKAALAPLLQELLALYDERDAVGLIIGLPLNMDGSIGPSAQSARSFASNLLKRRDLPLCFQDERLSSAAAGRALIACDTSRLRRKFLVDAAAAGLILQMLLDRRLADQH